MRGLILPAAVLVVPLLGMASWASAQAPTASAEAPKGSAENGKKIFTSYGCYQCHNFAAHGGGAGARLAPRPLPFSAFSQYVRAPKGQMPPYTRRIVTDQELADIYAFLLTIPNPPDANTIPILKP